MRYMEMALKKEWNEELYRLMASKVGGFIISSFYLLEGIRPTSPEYKELFLISSPPEVRAVHMGSAELTKSGLSITMRYDISDTGTIEPLFMVRYRVSRGPLRGEHIGLFRREQRTLYLAIEQYTSAITARRIIETNMTQDGRWMGAAIYELTERAVEFASLKLVPLL
ncbi:MAG: hypothetical protein RXR06_10550 [Thermoproteus sp.]